MELILWRHAEAEALGPDEQGDHMRDQLRVLTPKGSRHA